MRFLVFLAILLASTPVLAVEDPESPVFKDPFTAPPEAPKECQGDDVCVAREDLDKFIELARERQCLDRTPPTFRLDPITIITDKEGRVFYTGNDPKRPYKLRVDWCHYSLEAEGEVKVVAAMNEPPTWGFRFRPKAYLGYLPLKLIEKGSSFSDGIDAGLMLDFFYVRWVNVNIAAGFRSTGAGAGFDITENFGAYIGYAFAWGMDPAHNVLGSIYFAF